MRTNEPDPSPWRPLGEKVIPPAPPPPPPKPIAKNVVQDADGKFRTEKYEPRT